MIKQVLPSIPNKTMKVNQMSISRSKTILVSAFAAGMMSWQPAIAGFNQGPTVTLGSQPMFRMASAGGYTGEHRAWLAQDALDNALVQASDRSPSALRIARTNGAVVLTLDGRTVATVDSESANAANLSVDQLASEWAQSIQRFLGNSEQTNAYVATLKNEHQVQASIALLERRMYAPAGLTFPINLSTLIVSADAKEGDKFEATIDRDVVMGHYVIPAGSFVLGEIVQGDGDNFNLRVDSLRTLNGTMIPISAFVTDTLVVASKTAHPVCTYVIPSGSANNQPLIIGRIPAGIGIGTEERASDRLFAFSRSTGNLIVGRPLMLRFKEVSQVAVVVRTAM
ncbi:MAG: hypothetical protein C0469_10705 [Cyanobacteria bacterium DS2.3.42]|nr:hypothetical protein [Cyanobacteria bacterium DS2.3.42]